MDKVDPRFKKSSIDRLEPNCEIPTTDSVDPSRRKLRKDKEEPRVTKSNTDTEVMRLMP